jgi:hypothetical protein
VLKDLIAANLPSTIGSFGMPDKRKVQVPQKHM